MTELTPTGRIERAIAMADGPSFRIKQTVNIVRLSRGDDMVVGTIVDGVSRNLRRQIGDRHLMVWFRDDGAAADVAPLPELERSGMQKSLQLKGTTAQWSGDEANRVGVISMLGATFEPSLALPLLAHCKDHAIDGASPGSTYATVPLSELLKRLNYPADIVRDTMAASGLSDRRNIAEHLRSGAEPRLDDLPASVSAAFADDGSVEFVEFVVDLGPLLAAAMGSHRAPESYPFIAMVQEFEASDDVDAPVPFPKDAVDVSARLVEQLQRRREPAAEPPRQTMAIPDGPLQIDPGMKEALRANAGAMPFALRNVEPASGLEAALDAMRTALYGIGHPDEPEEPLPSFVSDITITDDGGWISADISDMEEEDDVLDQLIAAVAIAATSHLSAGELSASRLS